MRCWPHHARLQSFKLSGQKQRVTYATLAALSRTSSVSAFSRPRGAALQQIVQLARGRYWASDRLTQGLHNLAVCL